MTHRLPTRLVVLVAALAVFAIAGLTAALSASRSTGHTDPGLAPDPRSEIVGNWQPVEIAGYRVPAAYPNALQTARISFSANGTWRGSDGCNGLGGTYRLSGEGRFHSPPSASTDIGCANVPNGQVVGSATHVHCVGDGLVFLDDAGRELGSYHRVATMPPAVPMASAGAPQP